MRFYGLTPSPLRLRGAAWLLVMAQLCSPYCVLVPAAGFAPAPTAPPSAASTAGKSLTAAPPTINRTIPPVQAPPAAPGFSASPSDAEFFGARVFPEPLLPVGSTTPEHNRVAAQALLAFIQRANVEDDSALSAFLAQHPRSPWKASLLFNLGLFYRHQCYFSRAVAAWEAAWAITRGETEPRAGQQFPAVNKVNPANPAIRYVHPQIGQSVVQDTVTKEIIHFGGPGYGYRV